MSVSSLSQTLQQRILNNLISNVKLDIEKATALRPGKRFGSSFIAVEVTTSNMTRIITDPNQTGIFGLSGLKELASGFNRISQGLSKVGSRVLDKNGEVSKQPGYKNLKTYLKNYIKDKPSELDALQQAVKDLAQKADARLSDPNLYSEFLSYVEKSFPEKNVQETEGVFTLSGLEHGTINKLFDKYLLENNTDSVLVEFISANTDAGHLLGIFNQKLFRAFGAVADNTYDLGSLSVDILSNIEQNEKQDKDAINKLNNTFSAAFNLMESIDFLSSSIKATPDVFVKLSKEVYVDPDSPKSAAEIQLSIDNGGTGDLLKDAGKKLEAIIKSAQTAKYINVPGTTQQVRDPKSANFAEQLEGLFKQIGSIATAAKQMGESLVTVENRILDSYVKKIVANADKFGEILLNAEGSDSVKTAIAKRLASAISGKALPNPSNTKVEKNLLAKTKSTSAKKSGASPTKPTVPTKKSVSATKTTKRRQLPGTLTVNLTSLQSLLDASLVQRIKQNMGSGSSRSVLNLRSGRLAESAKVERLSESRAGMITAFYSYMKNPYATFSDGGQQSSPKSRDPKLLISKSIREIAQQQVANRLRAVNI